MAYLLHRLDTKMSCASGFGTPNGSWYFTSQNFSSKLLHSYPLASFGFVHKHSPPFGCTIPFADCLMYTRCIIFLGRESSITFSSVLASRQGIFHGREAC